MVFSVKYFDPLVAPQVFVNLIRENLEKAILFNQLISLPSLCVFSSQNLIVGILLAKRHIFIRGLF